MNNTAIPCSNHTTSSAAADNNAGSGGGDISHSTTTATTHVRQKWGTRLSFIMATIGAAVGFGSFVRFPYLAYKIQIESTFSSLIKSPVISEKE